MASHEAPVLSLGEKIHAFSYLGLAFFDAVRKLITTAFHGRKIKPWQKRLLGHVVKSSYVRSMPSSYRRATVGLPTGTIISQVCKAKSLSHDVVLFSVSAQYADATLHFIDCPAEVTGSGPLLLFLHGGGYANAINPNQVETVIDFAHAAKASLVVLEYTLAPEAKYPSQLVQAIGAIRHLLARRDPGKIVLVGDSAGGNMLLGVLAHCIESSPYAPAIEATRAVPFRGVLLLSAWVATEYTAGTYASNGDIDYIDRDYLEMFHELWQPKEGEVWANALVKGQDFWAQLPVARTLLTTGTWEVLYDDDLAMAKRLGAGETNSSVELLEFEEDFHDGIFLDAAVGIRDSANVKRVLGWLAQL